MHVLQIPGAEIIQSGLILDENWRENRHIDLDDMCDLGETVKIHQYGDSIRLHRQCQKNPRYRGLRREWRASASQQFEETCWNIR